MEETVGFRPWKNNPMLGVGSWWFTLESCPRVLRTARGTGTAQCDYSRPPVSIPDSAVVTRGGIREVARVGKKEERRGAAASVARAAAMSVGVSDPCTNLFWLMEAAVRAP